MDSDPDREEVLQSFLTKNPLLLSPTYEAMWLKLAFGSTKSDFVFREAGGEYVLIELERSTHKLFRQDGQPTSAFTHARGQTQDWKRYIEDNLSTVQTELGLAGISTNPKTIVVMGRSKDLSDANRRKLTTIENEAPRLKVLTYDDVYERARALGENILGPLKGEVGNTQVYYLPRS